MIYMSENKVIVLVGSTKFKDEFRKYEKEFTLKGYIVLTLHVFSHADNETLNDDTLAMLKDLHLRKIGLADKVFVINKNGYIGHTTNYEITYAQALQIPVEYMEPPLKETKKPNNTNFEQIRDIFPHAISSDILVKRTCPAPFKGLTVCPMKNNNDLHKCHDYTDNTCINCAETFWNSNDKG